MNITQALDILTALADGVDPVTGEILPVDSPCQQVEVVRALFVAIQSLERQCRGNPKTDSPPAKAGKAWTAEEEAELLRGFEAGRNLPDLAGHHERTNGAIFARLVHLGKFASRDEARATMQTR